MEDQTLTWKRRYPFRMGASDPFYFSDEGSYLVKRRAWKMTRKVVPMRGDQSPYYRRYTMKGWAIYQGGRYITRRRTLALAKGVAEAHSRGISITILDR